MQPQHKIPFGFATRKIVAIDYSYPLAGSGEGRAAPGQGAGGGGTGNPPIQPSNIYYCPPNARAHLRGKALGPAGALAYLAFAVQDLVSAPSGDPHGMFPGSLVVPCGAEFKLALNQDQTIWAVASIATNMPLGNPDSSVYLSFNWELFYYSGALPATNGGYDRDAHDTGRGDR